jgi:2-oxoglutarate ferredoxin oxidoreductase subunit gamma
MSRFDIRLAGLGGQGLLMAGLIIGDAAAVYDGLNAVQTVNYAPLARGAPSRAEVAISDGPIYFPEVEEADVLLAMSQDAYDTFKGEVKPDGLIILNSSMVKGEEDSRIKEFPISEMSQTATGRDLAGSIVGLGLISRLTKKVSADALRKAIKSRAPRGTVELNLRALEAGLNNNARAVV